MPTRFQFRPPEMFTGSALTTACLNDPLCITVEWRGGETWAVMRGSGWSPQRVWCEQAGEWEIEPQPSSRDNDFLQRCRYSLEEGLEIGRRLAVAPATRS